MDRLKQLDRFRRSLDGTASRRIILVSAGSGMGKSWLLKQFASEAEGRGARSVLIDFSDGQAYDVLTLVRRFRDSLGETHFNKLTAAINEATAPRLVISDSGGGGTGVNFGSSQIGDVSIGDVAGRNVIKDNLFIFQADNPLVIQAIEDRITQVFFACLSEIEAAGPALFLFDTYERTSQSSEAWSPNVTDRWITRELLTRIRDGRLRNTVVVLAGRRLPSFGVEWSQVIGVMPIDLFTQADVSAYLRENRGLSSLTDAEVQTLYNAVQGSPQLLGIIGDNLEQTVRPGDEDDW
ncbi:ATP-binding protein [Oscillochloris sp. ZM17-4]|uniref:ATP-binding protein n=1 Tax=Oscillochloris sp. ZM17-4 TaxID=2866714 RepID=UPI001C735F85|nr:ATP-binding protein [Oscillochloris sp. ZM17-4]MBX0326346.1 ATP-binding protein [Oscillochloris sp. ZM17-4]